MTAELEVVQLINSEYLYTYSCSFHSSLVAKSPKILLSHVSAVYDCPTSTVVRQHFDKQGCANNGPCIFTASQDANCPQKAFTMCKQQLYDYYGRSGLLICGNEKSFYFSFFKSSTYVRTYIVCACTKIDQRIFLKRCLCLESFDFPAENFQLNYQICAARSFVFLHICELLC